jgi:hypothetical protein
MIDRPVRHGDLPQGVSFMTFLPARRLVRRLAQSARTARSRKKFKKKQPARKAARVTIPLSRLEASGMAFSVPFTVRYDGPVLDIELGQAAIDACSK